MKKNNYFFITFFYLVVSFGSTQNLNWYVKDSIWYNSRTNEQKKLTFENSHINSTVFLNNLTYSFDYANKNLPPLICKYIIHIDKASRFLIVENDKTSYGENFLALYTIFAEKFKLNCIEYKGSNGSISIEGAVRTANRKFTDEDWYEVRKIYSPEATGFLYYDGGIKKISASSHLTEFINTKKIEYKENNLIDKVGVSLYPGSGFDYDNYRRCWAEGVEGSGLNEYLNIEFKWGTDYIEVLNGYIDFFDKEKYIQNNRLKTIKVESFNPAFELEYSFEDFVAFHMVKFPMKTKQVKITINSVYKGIKYDDTCISAIMAGQERWRSEEEERKEVEEYIKKYNIDEKLKNELSK